MAEEIKAIPTSYNGFQFRSRLEARWAVFFDYLGAEYQYEAEGYRMGDENQYLPDFFLPTSNLIVEIKPDRSYSSLNEPMRQAQKLKSFYESYLPEFPGRGFIIVFGLPGILPYGMAIVWSAREKEFYFDNPAYLIPCKCGRAEPFHFTVLATEEDAFHGGQLKYATDREKIASPKMLGAYKAARTARFD